MWKHQMDPEVKKELERFQRIFDIHNTQINELLQSQKALEDKLDSLIAAIESPQERSIEEDGKKVERLAVGPGFKPWSQRKQQRIASAKDPSFINKVKSGAATTPSEETDAD